MYILSMHLLFISLNNNISETMILCCFVQALHEALMRQEELLAYIDRQEEAKFRVGLLIHHSLIFAQYIRDLFIFFPHT